MLIHSPKTDSNKTQVVPTRQEKDKTLHSDSLQGALAGPGLSLSPENIVQLQRVIGNQAVLQLLKNRSQQHSAYHPLQRMEPEEELQMKQDDTMQKQKVPGDDEEFLMKPESGAIQRIELLDEEELQMKQDNTTNIPIFNARDAGSNSDVQSSIPSDLTMQRKVAIAQENKNDENDWVILTNLKYAMGLVGGTVTDLGPGSDFSDMSKEESLAIVGHGSAGEIQGFDAGKIAKAITRSGKAMPKTAPYLILLSCNAAKPKEANNVRTSLVSELAFILRRTHGYDTIVEGKPSYTQVSEATGVNATKPDKEKEHMGIEKPLIAKHNLCFTTKPSKLSDERKVWLKRMCKLDDDFIQKNEDRICDWLAKNQILKLVTEIMDENNVDWKELSIEQRATWISNYTRGLYLELAEAANKGGTLFKSGRGPGSGTTLAYGAAILEI